MIVNSTDYVLIDYMVTVLVVMLVMGKTVAEDGKRDVEIKKNTQKPIFAFRKRSHAQ